MKRKSLILLCLVLAFALALPMLASAVPPNEVALKKALRKQGVIPLSATPAQEDFFYKAYLSKLFSKRPDDPGNPIAQKTIAEGEAAGSPRFGHVAYKAPSLTADNVLVLLVQFGGGAGPLHNKMTKPGAGDNTNLWVPDFSPSYYQNMLFNRSGAPKSMASYFLTQSGGTYTVKGDVSPVWVTLPYPESWYGADSSNGDGSDDLNGPVWRVVADAVKVAGTSINWARYDVEDPNDLDGDGKFNEPDGYVDHLMVVHAGAGQEGGGGAQGSDAIWSHSWFVNSGNDGPGYGGVETSNPKVWVGPYTIMPEDGAVGVFVHEFSHDLGLPDQYDTIYSGTPSTEFWTLMAGGSWLSNANQPLGTSPSSLDIWSKYMLGWAKPQVVGVGQNKSGIQLKSTNASNLTGKALMVDLPDYTYTYKVFKPHPDGAPLPSGDGVVTNGTIINTYWYSGSGDNIEHTLTKQVTFGPNPAVDFEEIYDIEDGYDYGYLEVTDVPNPGRSDWDQQLSVTGDSEGWHHHSVEVDSQFANKTVTLRFRYSTDGGVSNMGWGIDDISIDGGPVDNVDTSNGWVSDGWMMTDGIVEATASHYYLAEWRQAQSFDLSMNSWYNWIGDYTVENYRANPGMLLWYRNTRYSDNHVGVHPWAGQLLAVDAHPALLRNTVPETVSTRIQIVDAPFNLIPTYGGKITAWGYPVTIPRLAGQPVFDDSAMWYDPSADYTQSISSVETPQYGVKISVVNQNPTYGTINVRGARGSSRTFK